MVFTEDRNSAPDVIIVAVRDNQAIQALDTEPAKELKHEPIIGKATVQNDRATSLTKFTWIEEGGAKVFRDRCASCHAARLIAEEPSTEVPFDKWEKLVLSPSGPIVWNNAQYAKTGIEPYVHDEGTRVPTLRRLYKKWPYFTNGGADSLTAVLEGIRVGEESCDHELGPANVETDGLDDREREALLAFLRLL